MKLLLDTHALLWYVLNDPELSATARALIMDPKNQVLVSAASFWELAIKVSINKIMLHQPLESFIDVCFNKYGFTLLAIEPQHIVRTTVLPFHHKDPFDRMLVAQSLVEPTDLVSDDQVLDAYGIQRLW